MTQSKSVSAWRPTFRPVEWASLLANAAIQLEIEGVSGPEDFADPEERKARERAAALALSIIKSSLEHIASGGSSSVELGEGLEVFFQRCRSEKKEHEIVSQEAAIKDFLGVEGDGEIMISELQLVEGAIRAARDLNQNTNYGLSNLIRDGIRRVGQEMISNAINRSNRKPGSKSFTTPGANWPLYEQAYTALQNECGTPAWTKRKSYITIGFIAQRASTNVVQIRRWAESTGKEIVPRPDEREDPTAGLKIVDENL